MNQTLELRKFKMIEVKMIEETTILPFSNSFTPIKFMQILKG